MGSPIVPFTLADFDPIRPLLAGQEQAKTRATLELAQQKATQADRRFGLDVAKTQGQLANQQSLIDNRTQQQAGRQLNMLIDIAKKDPKLANKLVADGEFDEAFRTLGHEPGQFHFNETGQPSGKYLVKYTDTGTGEVKLLNKATGEVTVVDTVTPTAKDAEGGAPTPSKVKGAALAKYIANPDSLNARERLLVNKELSDGAVRSAISQLQSDSKFLIEQNKAARSGDYSTVQQLITDRTKLIRDAEDVDRTRRTTASGEPAVGGAGTPGFSSSSPGAPSSPPPAAGSSSGDSISRSALEAMRKSGQVTLTDEELKAGGITIDEDGQ